MSKLDNLNKRIESLTRERDAVLRKVRLECNHTRLVELDSSPPERICLDCGAEEYGWHCGYHILVIDGDNNWLNRPYGVLVKRTSNSNEFYRQRKFGGLYYVGQSHPDFGGGLKTVEQLTSISA